MGQNNGSYQAIHLCARFGRDKGALLLLSYGADPNSFAEVSCDVDKIIM